MKRAHLIEWGIIVIALIFGYKFFESIISVFVQIIFSWNRHDDLAAFFLRYILVIGLYAAAFFILIRNSGKLAIYFSREDSPENTIHIKIGKRPMLQVILVAICISAIVFNIADIIYYLFETFRTEVRTRDFFDEQVKAAPGKYEFIVSSIEIAIAIILIYFSKDISNLLISKNEADELVFDSKPQN